MQQTGRRLARIPSEMLHIAEKSEKNNAGNEDNHEYDFKACFKNRQSYRQQKNHN